MDPAVLAALEPEQLRAVIPGFISGYIADSDAAAHNRARVAELVAGWSEAQLRGLVHTLATVGDEHVLYRANPECRLIGRVWARDVIAPDARVLGAANLRQAMDAGPTVIVSNHLSYFDTNATDAALAWDGHADLAERIATAAGPKVYSDLFRRVAAASLNTLPVPQSTSLGHTEQIAPRELARRAIASLGAAQQLLDDGFALLVYPEGSRTRTGRLRPFLRAVHRYLAPARFVVPAAIVGTNRILTLADDRAHPGPVTLSFGAPIEVSAAGGGRGALEAAHAAVAALLPEEMRPEDGEAAVD